jgi:hypothetical protein
MSGSAASVLRQPRVMSYSTARYAYRFRYRLHRQS